ncbi:MAG: hypothetical protein QXT19_02560, partial [Candidatus Woesearchaeota archaeon]
AGIICRGLNALATLFLTGFEHPVTSFPDLLEQSSRRNPAAGIICRGLNALATLFLTGFEHPVTSFPDLLEQSSRRNPAAGIFFYSSEFLNHVFSFKFIT